MTIDSGWVRVMKEEVPEAFRTSYPFKGTPGVAYIDGMPLLMISEKSVRSWDDLLRNNYARHIQRYYKLGCHTVVLAFDDYERVPASKAITQANRSKKKAAYEFGEGQQLPPTVPHGYNEKLSNRIFKRRVIDMVCNRVASTIVLNGKDTYCKRFVIDYTGCPIAFEGCVGSVNFNNCPPKFMTDVPPMGEADIKFLRWSDHFRKADMIAFSIDGDFIPIALIRREQQLLRRKLWDQEQQQQQQKQPCPEAPLDATKKPPSPPPVANIAIYRIKYRVPGSATAASAPQKCTSISANKRQKLNGTGDDATKYQNLIVQPKGPGGSLGLAAPPQLVAQSRQETSIDNKKERCNSVREWEYVDIPKLHAAMQAAFSRMCPMVARNPLHKFHYMRMLAVLIGLSGTDFSRGLPLVGPGTLWNMLGDGGGVLAALLRAYNLKEGLIDSAAARDGLAACIYMSKFASHFRDARFSLADKKTGTKKRSHKTSSAAASAITIIESSSEDDAPSDSSEDDCGGGTESHRGGFQRSLGVLKASSLSERTRNDLPSAFRVEVTMRNINWLLRYWECVPPVRCAASDEEDNSGGWDYSGCYPDPICDEYGFKARSRTGKGKGKALPASSLPSIQWLDEDDEGGGSGEKRTRKGKDKRHKGSDDEDNDDF